MASRNVMAPQNEPTDEELALVMREAREVAVRRSALADAWITSRLEEATQFAKEHGGSWRNPGSR